MKKLIALAASGLLGFGMLTIDTTPSDAAKRGGGGISRGGGGGRVVAPRAYSGHSHGYRSHRGRNIAIGVGTAIVGGIIANEVYRSGGYSCASLERRCDAGNDWACRQLDHNDC